MDGFPKLESISGTLRPDGETELEARLLVRSEERSFHSIDPFIDSSLGENADQARRFRKAVKTVCSRGKGYCPSRPQERAQIGSRKHNEPGRRAPRALLVPTLRPKNSSIVHNQAHADSVSPERYISLPRRYLRSIGTNHALADADRNWPKSTVR